jgi:predicted CopG family antitoxin
MRDWETTRFTKSIKITEEDYECVKENKGKKSAAGFLKPIIKQYRDGEANHHRRH